MSSSNDALEVARGRDDSFTLTIQGPDETGREGPVTFGDADIIDASVWVGESEAEIYSPGAEWLDAAGGEITLTFDAAGTAGLAPGSYPLEVYVTPAGGPLKVRAASLWLTVVDSPGIDETSLPVYCSYQDLRTNGGGDWLDMLRREGLANCLRERADAREWLDDVILKAFRPLDPRGNYRAALDSGSTHPDAPDPHPVALLAAGGLRQTRIVKRLAALKALELVCRSRLTFESGDVWSKRAAYFAAESNRLATLSRVEIAGDDGATLYAIHLGTCSIR